MIRKRSGLKAKVVNVMLTATKLDEKLKLTSSIMRKIKPSIAFMNIILFNILTLFFSALSISSEIPFSETFFQI
jgi:hypothetical protein